jgi:hypothetical protein
VVAIGKDYVAVLSTNERGPVERRKAGTRLQAFAAARTLLDVAETGIGARRSASRCGRRRIRKAAASTALGRRQYGSRVMISSVSG